MSEKSRGKWQKDKCNYRKDYWLGGEEGLAWGTDNDDSTKVI